MVRAEMVDSIVLATTQRPHLDSKDRTDSSVYLINYYSFDTTAESY